MDVTRSNFQEVLEEVDAQIQQASFLAIDTEFTGLQDGLSTKILALDTPAERYRKIRDGAAKFLVVQFGLSIFQYDDNIGKFLCRSYNFYLFPNNNSLPGHPDISFLCQASSIAFLASHDFDFNKLFRDGIPYLNLADEEKIKKALEDKFQSENKNFTETSAPLGPSHVNHMLEIPVEQREFMEDTMKKIEVFLSEEDGAEKEEKQLVLENLSAFQRKLIFIHGRAKFPAAFFQSKKLDHNNDRIMIVQKSTPESKEELTKRECLLSWNELEKAVGFTHVLRKITNSGKLVVGHNMLLDVVHIIHQFYAELPADYGEFKEMVKAVFPRILDTKCMATSQPLRDLLSNSALEPLFKSLQKPPFRMCEIEPTPGMPSYSAYQSKAHEAGYDSFITGLCFIAMSTYLGEKNEAVNERYHEKSLADSPLIAVFTQKLFMMMSNDIPYMNISGPDLEPCRDHIFYMTFPKIWKLQDIFQLFSIYGPVFVNWLGDTSAYVTLLRKENQHLVLKNIQPPPGCTILSYRAHLTSSVSPSLLHRTPTSLEEHGTAVKTPRKKRSADTEASAPSAKITRQSEKGKSVIAGQFEIDNNWN